MSLYVCLCMISNQSTSKKPHVSELSKLDTLLHNKTHIKVLLVLRYQGSTCVDPYHHSAHQMWHDHPFSIRNRTTKRTEEVRLEVTRKWGVGQHLKK